VEWFFALEPPTQVAIIGVLTGVVTAMGAVGVAAVNNARKGGSGGSAEIAAVTMDSSAVKHVAAALEAINVTLTEQNKLAREGGPELVSALKDVADEVEELRREVRQMTDKMRGPR
jgi:HAMP domain-containing protein